MENTNNKITSRAKQLDECLAEISPEARADIEAYIDWICEFVLLDNAGVKSAKELVIMLERWKYTQEKNNE